MNYQVGNYISTEYGELPIKHVVFDQYQVTGKDGRILWVNKIEPIELTEEWLIKKTYCNLKQTTYKAILLVVKNYYIELIIESDGKICYMVNDFQVRVLDYIHDLQNLVFALTGTELKINV